MPSVRATPCPSRSAAEATACRAAGEQVYGVCFYVPQQRPNNEVADKNQEVHLHLKETEEYKRRRRLLSDEYLLLCNVKCWLDI